VAELVAVERLRARTLLDGAAQLFDDPRRGLDALARRAAWRGFAGGAEWMRAALGLLRGKPPRGGEHGFQRLGIAKYSLAALAALLVVSAALASELVWLAPLAVPAFYVVEVRMVFAFPLALDGEPRPLRASHRLLAAHHGALAATVTVMQLAAVMLAGGFAAQGFRRSWCLGCLAVLLWYERVRASEVP
jgi:hypothetical protein